MLKRASLGMLVFIGLALVSACGSSSQPQSETIKIGFFGPLTGASASDGNNAMHAAKLAIDQANANQSVPGKTFELVAYDDQLEPNQAITVAQKLVTEDKVRAVIGGSYSSTTRAAAPIFQQAGIPMLAAYATHPDVTKTGSMIFRVIYITTVQGKALAQYATTKLNYRNFHVLNINNDYGRSVTEAFTKTAIANQSTIVSTSEYTSDTSDFSSQIATIKAKPADALILIGYYAQSADIIKQVRQAGITLPIIGSDGLDSPSLVKLGGSDVEGVILATDFSRNDPRAIVQNFIREFRNAYNIDPDVVASSTYDATNLLIDAFKRSPNSSSSTIRDSLAATQTFEGVTGVIAFTPEREVNKTVLFVQIERGDFIFLDKLDPSQLR
ncbi:ABC transporter substrate-binding protein [Herpetosiphon giganteus]|uniref:ABC transporter substrate-binding protein n=1 Tax=Herpetosiphon giganteus TaxID=2029754 RepID=UPI0019574C48|nr:ABC transporter substrate-binding protein [Herpetosiphon giganteus]MBM7843502.1 branched-chain amino acid transport system substrate-binding protein [Herpetosiphon giganteus]